jgi:coenzyme F420-dependent glucose-6-phosphate dehydrogenase
LSPSIDRPRLEVGICPDNQWEDFRATVERAPALENAGFDAIWLGDHTLPFQHSRGFNRSVIVEMGAYLHVTESILVGAMVIAPIGLRHHPVDVALDLATLALLNPGRVSLAVGSGEAMNERNTTAVWPGGRERMERLAEAIALIQRCWQADDYFTHAGDYFQSFFYLYTKPSPPIPLLCAANGARTARIAGALADGFCCVGVSPEDFEQRLLPAFAAGVQAAGRNPETMQRIVWVPTTYHPDPEEARRASKLEAGVLVRGALESVTDPREMEALGAGVPDEEIRKASCVASTAEEIVTHFRAYAAAGATHVVWGDLSPDPDLVPDLARDHVIPALRDVQVGRCRL